MSSWTIDGGAGAWLGTVALHGLVWLGLVLAVSRCWRGMPAAVEEWLWRGALLATLLGPSITGVTRESVGSSAEATITPRAAVVAEEASVASLPDAPMDPYPAPAEAVALAAEPAPVDWEPFALWAALGLALLGLARYLHQWRCLATLLRSRRAADPALRKELAALTGKAVAPRLTVSDAIRSPIVFGWRRAEICLPSVAAFVSRGARRGMLAHELAHVRRRDPLWLGAVRLLRALLWWHPLAQVAHRRLQDVAERRADDLAARRVGPRSVAKGLVQAAEWVAQEPQVLIGAVPMAGGVLTRRVDLLLADRRSRTRLRHWLVAGSLGLGAFCSLARTVPGPAWHTAAPVEEAATAFLSNAVDSASAYTAWAQCHVVLDQIAAQQSELEARLTRLAADPRGAADAREIADLRARLETLSDLRRQAVRLMKQWAAVITEEQDGNQSGSDNERKR